MSFLKKQKGGVKDTEDKRDLQYQYISGKSYEKLPESFKLDFNSKIKQQGRTSSCGCQASSLALGVITNKELSARFAFKTIKTNPKYPSSKLKWGQYTRDAVKVMCEDGTCDEALAPEQKTYSDKAYIDLKIKPQMEISALENKAKTYVRVDGLFGNDFEAVKEFIHKEKKPVVVALPWYSSYNKGKKTGIIPPPAGKSIGHIVLCIGWSKDRYIFANSYGKNWGKNGIFMADRSIPTWDCWGIIEKKIYKIVQPKRNIEKEKKKAKIMQEVLYNSFDSHDKARGVAGREWLKIIQAITYKGYSYVDMINYCYAKSRNKNIPFDLTNNRF